MLHLEHEPDVAGQNSLKFLASLVQFFFLGNPRAIASLCLCQLGHETSQDVLVHVRSFPPAFFFGIGIQTPYFPLADTELQELVSTIVDGKVEFVKEDAIRQSFRRRDQSSVSLVGQGFSDRLHLSERIDGGGGRLDGIGGYLDVFRRIDKILPLEIIGADFTVKLIPSRGDHHSDRTRTVLEGFLTSRETQIRAGEELAVEAHKSKPN